MALQAEGREGSWPALVTVVAAVSAGLLAYGLTLAWFDDECYHLLAAQLVNAGKRPYLDFFHQQAPLYAYVNGGWFRLFGQGWRSAQALSAILTGGSIVLVAGFVFSRVRIAREINRVTPNEGEVLAYDERLAAGHFATVVLAPGDPKIEKFSLPRLYAGRTSFGDFDVFWRRVTPGREPR